MAQVKDEHVLVSGSTFDDAGIYKVSDELALVQTVDFFTPMVDDPYDFGRVAVANSLSDVYAMGGIPKTALNIVSFPIHCLDHSILRDILRGGADMLAEAGVVLLGGHTIDDPEPKYGVSVTGYVHPEEVWTNGGARPGDVLVLTKKLGVGMVTTAIKGDLGAVAEREIVEVTESMAKLNRLGADIARAVGSIHGCTDVTGFGLGGHMLEMIGDGPITFQIDSSALPFLEKALDYAKEGIIPAGAYRNRDHVKGRIEFLVPEFMELAVCCPETSGGLLLAFPPEAGADYVRKMEEAGELAVIIGRVTDRQEAEITVY